MTATRLALFGTSGAGKSTCSRLLEEICVEHGRAFARVRLAEPLYECQALIYAIAGRPLSDRYQQDGTLLNFLGSHLRTINPTVLTDSFTQRVDSLIADDTKRKGPLLVLCDDMRAADASHLRGIGFVFARVEADPELCLHRRRIRGDTSLGSDTHPTERGLDTIQSDYVIPNEGSLRDLRERLNELIRELW